jgi:hypothetical protein
VSGIFLVVLVVLGGLLKARTVAFICLLASLDWSRKVWKNSSLRLDTVEETQTLLQRLDINAIKCNLLSEPMTEDQELLVLGGQDGCLDGCLDGVGHIGVNREGVDNSDSGHIEIQLV